MKVREALALWPSANGYLLIGHYDGSGHRRTINIHGRKTASALYGDRELISAHGPRIWPEAYGMMPRIEFNEEGGAEDDREAIRVPAQILE